MSSLFCTFAYAANEMSGNVLVVDPPGGQMKNYVSGRPLTVSKRIKANSWYGWHLK